MKKISFKKLFLVAIFQHIKKDKKYFETLPALRFCSSLHNLQFDDQSLHYKVMSENVQVKK